MTTFRQAVRFGGVGLIGFIVDAFVVTWLSSGLGVAFYAARAVSFLAAVTTTWFLNRKFTFRDDNPAVVLQWLHFLSANAFGGTVNFGVFMACVAYSDAVAAIPALGVAAGSLAGAGVNFALSKRYVFNKSVH
ncbi:MAG: GtrA family protein [Pseudomonadota bacterium]